MTEGPWAPLPRGRLTVPVLIPYVVERGEAVSPSYNTPEFRAEVADWFVGLDVAWSWCPVTVPSVPDLVSGFMAIDRSTPLIAFNLCEGFDDDGYPGVSLIEALEAGGIAFTGAGSQFYRISSDKLAMKERFRAARVPTAAFVELALPERDVPRIEHEVGYPAIIKVARSCDGGGLDRTSVVGDERTARDRVEQLVAEGLAPLRIFAERFLPGREITVLVHDGADGPMALPGVEMVYAPELPVPERILFHGHRLLDPTGQPRSLGGTARCTYAPAPQALAATLTATALAAYRACGGTGYARVDMRCDAGGVVHALEVNANPSLSRQEPSIAPALDAAHLPFEALIMRFLQSATARARQHRAHN